MRGLTQGSSTNDVYCLSIFLDSLQPRPPFSNNFSMASRIWPDITVDVIYGRPHFFSDKISLVMHSLNLFSGHDMCWTRSNSLKLVYTVLVCSAQEVRHPSNLMNESNQCSLAT